MSRRKIAQQSLFLIVFKMAALLVEMHETVKDYIDSSENQPLVTEIGSKLLQLSRAVIKKHTFDGERAYKFHLAQPARMLLRSFTYWHKTILRKLKRKTLASRPWTVFSSWNLPLKVFDCFKVVAVTPENGGSIVKNTRAVQEIYITDMGKLKGLFLRVPNKVAKGCINESDIFMKKEKDGSYSHVLVTKDHPVIFKYSKNLEIIRVSLRYGHFNRVGVPQHSLASKN